MAAAKRAEALLFSAERATDDALIAIAKLNAFLPEARLEARLAACIGHEAMLRGMAAQAKMLDARSMLLETHSELDQARGVMGLPAHAFGGGDLKPEYTTPAGALGTPANAIG